MEYIPMDFIDGETIYIVDYYKHQVYKTTFYGYKDKDRVILKLRRKRRYLRFRHQCYRNLEDATRCCEFLKEKKNVANK